MFETRYEIPNEYEYAIEKVNTIPENELQDPESQQTLKMNPVHMQNLKNIEKVTMSAKIVFNNINTIPELL